jgi:membrane protein YqaA with SNARE-associated domain
LRDSSERSLREVANKTVPWKVGKSKVVERSTRIHRARKVNAKWLAGDRSPPILATIHDWPTAIEAVPVKLWLDFWPEVRVEAVNEANLAAGPTPRNPLKRLYHWVLHWAETPYGTPALAIIAFAESSFFPIPPDVLQIALSVSKPRRSFYYAAVSALASVLGGIAGWYIGRALWAGVDDFFFNYVPGFSHANFDGVGSLYHENAFLAILAAAFTPIPYKVFTIAAGVWQVPLQTLVMASIVGRSGRFFLVATAMYFFGEPAKAFVERHFEWMTLALFALIVVGFMAIRWML